MSIISLLQEFDGKELGEEDGEPVIGRLMPGLNQGELKQLEGMIPCKIPSHISNLLSMTRGLKPALDCLDFSGLSLQAAFERKDLFPHGLPIAGDGMGNSGLSTSNRNPETGDRSFMSATIQPL